MPVNTLVYSSVIATAAAGAVVWLAINVNWALAVLIGPIAAVLGVVSSEKSQWRIADAVAAKADLWYRSVLDSSPDFLFVCSTDESVSYVSPSVERVLGEVRLETLDDVLDLLDPDRAVLSRDAVLESQAVIDEYITAVSLGDESATLDVRIRDERANPVVEGIVIFATDVTKEEALRHRLQHQAFIDELTGLPNRRALNDATEAAHARAARAGHTMALILLDLDGFKGVNDTLGHPFGDRLLAEIANRLQAETRSGETVGRLGGDEFAIVVEDRDSFDVERIGRRLLDAIALPIELDGQLLSIGCSAGISVLRGSESPEDMFRFADIALYESKRTGRGSLTVFRDEFEDLLAVEARLTQEIALGFERGEFSVVYQPLVSTSEPIAVGFEALLRWDSSTLGPVSPATFIPIAERSSAILDLGEWVLREACRQLAAWTELTDRQLSMSVNVSPRQLDDERFLDVVRTVLAETGIAPNCLMLEITESAMMDNIGKITKSLQELRDLGIRVALDDFGTGYSSLAKLQQLPVDCIKIDRTFVANSTTSETSASLLASILDIGRSLSVTVVAEGVENVAELANLATDPAPLVQGYYFGRPVNSIEALRYLEPGAFEQPEPVPAAEPTV
ncbi:MAG: EAL domain-containing protein [Acidimicrobiales bacterium]|nr:EAL domain-containing protein [Acidimicrobiales bacterium]